MGSDKIHMNEQFGTESIKIQGLEEFFELLAGELTDGPSANHSWTVRRALMRSLNK